jgi:hypothetical protein
LGTRGNAVKSKKLKKGRGEERIRKECRRIKRFRMKRERSKLDV